MPGKILYIEDNPMNMRLVQLILRNTDYVFLGAVTGEEGLRIAEETQPDLILLDIHMPDMSGIEVCEKLRAMPQFEKTPIIAVTARVREEDREGYIRQGFDEFLPKPVNRFVLRRVIESYLGQSEDTTRFD